MGQALSPANPGSSFCTVRCRCRSPAAGPRTARGALDRLEFFTPTAVRDGATPELAIPAGATELIASYGCRIRRR